MPLASLTNYLSELCQGRLALNKEQGINVFKVKQRKGGATDRARHLSGDALSTGLRRQQHQPTLRPTQVLATFLRLASSSRWFFLRIPSAKIAGNVPTRGSPWAIKI